MPRIGRRKSTPEPTHSSPGAPVDETWTDTELDDLVNHCLEAHAILEEHGTPAMRRLINLLLFEIGSRIGKDARGRRLPRDLN